MKRTEYTSSAARRSVMIAVLAAVLIILTAFPAVAQQLRTVGVVDVDLVYNTFYADSQAVRDLERLHNEYQTEIDGYLRELQSLRAERAEANQAGERDLVADLTEEIDELDTFISDLALQRRQQLQARQDALLSDEFLTNLQRAIEFVAEGEGYSLVLRSDTSGLQWWSQDVDISDAVLARLRQITN